MKVAFLGKGGSGKSTMATAFVQHVRAQGTRVLAIDADHNMDLSYNLGVSPSLFLGSDPDSIKEYVGSNRTESFAHAREVGKNKGISFTLSPADTFTERMSYRVADDLRLMTAGPHTERVRSQDACSHSLAAPLKVYLPLLRLMPNEAVVIDERAGTDPVATGILAGVDLAVIVREPTVTSQRVALHIEHELQRAGVRYLFVGNKVHGLEADTQRACELIVAHTS